MGFHDHGSHSHDHDHGSDHGHHHHHYVGKALFAALLVNFIFFIAELIGGWLTGSLALLSDAAHMFADVAALALSGFALWISERRATPSKTYGYYRAEVLAAFLNSLSLWVMVSWIFYEAVLRLHSPSPVHSKGMLAIATAGLLANLVSAAFLHRHAHHDLNIRSSYLHLLSDTLGSAAAIIASVIMIYTGNTLADPIASFAIGALTLYTSWGLMREAVDILMESTPRGIDTDAVRKALHEVKGIMSVHDLHIWSLGSRRFALSAHAIIHPGTVHRELHLKIKELLSHDFSIDHTTIQLEDEGSLQEESCLDCDAPPSTPG